MPPSMSRPLFLREHAHTWFWAITSLLALPASLIYFSYQGVTAFTSFFLGILATLLVLLLNVIMERRLWMFQAHWHEAFSRPDASLRLVILAGALLLIVESLAIMYLLVSPAADEALLQMVREHRCLVPSPQYAEFCELLTRW